MDSEASARPPARPCARPHVDSLLATLSPWDLLYLRDGFRKGDIKITGLATICDLPVEILSVIALQLGLEDLIRCRLVSRLWHATWTCGAVAIAVSHHLFPGLLEKAAMDQDLRCPEELLRSCIIRHLRHKHAVPFRSRFIAWNGRQSTSASELYRTWPEKLPPFRDHGPAAFYDEGFFAWQANSANVIMHDLRAGQSHLCNFASFLISGERPTLQGMSSRLLVFATGNSNVLRIWHFQSKDWKRITLAGPFARCYVQGEQVAVLTRQGIIIKWSWSASAIELDQTHPLNMAPEGYDSGLSLPGVILHPSHRDVTYVARIYRSKAEGPYPHPRERNYLMSVVRYHDAVPTRRWLETIREESLTTNFLNPVHVNFHLALLCVKMSAYGLYSIGTVLTPLPELGQFQVVEFATTGFNVCKEAFVQRRFDYAERKTLRSCESLLDPTVWYCSAYGECLTTWSNDHLMIPRYFISYETHILTSSDDEPVADFCRVFADEDFRIKVSSDGISVSSFATTIGSSGSFTSERLLTNAHLSVVVPRGIRPLAEDPSYIPPSGLII
ncbi:hypothetical protein E4U30_007876 [Claviceps sp. LM220 group G6]|nr:hypothetical protein E4U30_007876 [Claviceps sp. LM220 group G6]